MMKYSVGVLLLVIAEIVMGVCVDLPKSWIANAAAVKPAVLFSEGFEDSGLERRGWYDGNRFTLSTVDPLAGKSSIEYSWKDGGTTPVSSSGIRHLFEPSDTVCVRYYIRLSRGWGWSGVPYHPHLTHFMTTENDKYWGPA